MWSGCSCASCVSVRFDVKCQMCVCLRTASPPRQFFMCAGTECSSLTTPLVLDSPTPGRAKGMSRTRTKSATTSTRCCSSSTRSGASPTCAVLRHGHGLHDFGNLNARANFCASFSPHRWFCFFFRCSPMFSKLTCTSLVSLTADTMCRRSRTRFTSQTKRLPRARLKSRRLVPNLRVAQHCVWFVHFAQRGVSLSTHACLAPLLCPAVRKSRHDPFEGFCNRRWVDRPCGADHWLPRHDVQLGFVNTNR